MSDFLDGSGQAARMRQEFDDAFALPSSNAVLPSTDLLTVRVAGEPYALSISEISGLVCDRKIVHVPSSLSELLGVTGIRGGIVPVYNLAMLLGFSSNSEQLRWFALFGSANQVALAFNDFEGYVRIQTQDVIPVHDAIEPRRDHVKAIVCIGGVMRAVVSISSVEESIRRRAATSRFSKEN